MPSSFLIRPMEAGVRDASTRWRVRYGGIDSGICLAVLAILHHKIALGTGSMRPAATR
jgi:hypothetical protein